MTDKKLIVAPGAFDNFEGTQEELDELMAVIHQMVQSGTIFENSTPVSDEDAEAIWKNLEAAQQKRQ